MADILEEIRDRLDQLATRTGFPYEPPVTPTPAPQPTPTPAPVPTSQGELLWSWRPELGIVPGGWREDSSWQQQGPDGVYGDPNNTMPWPQKITTVAGRQSIEFALPENGKRNELLPNHPTHPNGDDRYFGVSLYLPQSYPLAASGWQVVWQVHGAPSTGSPPVALEATQGGLLLTGGWGRPGASPPERYAYSRRLMDLQHDRWYDIVIHIKFSDQPNSGLVDVWVDDQEVLKGFVPPCGTNYPGGPAYRKSGWYRSGGPAGVLYQAGHTLATGHGGARPRP